MRLENQERFGPSQSGFSVAASRGREPGSARGAAVAVVAANRDLWSTFPWNASIKVLETLWSHPQLCRDAGGLCSPELCRIWGFLNFPGPLLLPAFYSWKIYQEFCKDLGSVQAALSGESGGDEKAD